MVRILAPGSTIGRPRMGASRNRRKVILVTEVAVRLGLVLAFWGNIHIRSLVRL